MAYLDQLLATGETVQRVARRHWVAMVVSLLLNGLGVALFTFLAGVTTSLWRADGGWLAGLGALFFVAMVLLCCLRIVLDVLRWSSTQYVITTRRVIEISGVFNKLTRDSNLDKINDLVLFQSGLGRLLGYGDIEIITGADVGVNRLERIADPVGFKRTMLDNKEDFDTLARRAVVSD